MSAYRSEKCRLEGGQSLQNIRNSVDAHWIWDLKHAQVQCKSRPAVRAPGAIEQLQYGETHFPRAGWRCCVPEEAKDSSRSTDV